jgi:formate/nitrite transporter FocA (FNT family)
MNQTKELYGVFIKAILAGLMIGFGCIIYLMCTDKIIGAFLFSFGLLTIICRDLYLYTSKIGYLKEIGLAKIFVTIIGNFIGTFILGTAVQFTRLQPNIEKVVTPKLTDSLPSIFILSIACGIMMYLAADSYKKSKSWMFVMLPIAVFILSGFEHSIANMCYFTIANAWEPSTFLMIAIMILGNGVGSFIMNLKTYKAE